MYKNLNIQEFTNVLILSPLNITLRQFNGSLFYFTIFYLYVLLTGVFCFINEIHLYRRVLYLLKIFVCKVNLAHPVFKFWIHP